MTGADITVCFGLLNLAVNDFLIVLFDSSPICATVQLYDQD